MKIEIIATYDEEERILRVKNEHDVQWKIETGVPEIYLSSLIGSSFAIAIRARLFVTAKKNHKYKLTIEEK